MRLIITTLGRITRQETLRNLPDPVGEKVELWVQAHEFENSCLYYDDVHCLPEHIRTLGATRQYLVDLYWGEKIVLMDDDLTFYWREDPDKWNLTIPPPERLGEMFETIENVLDVYAHIGLSGREGQNREPASHVENTRYMRFLAYNTALWPQDRRVRMDRVDGMSDFDTNMQLLRAGLPNRVYYCWAQGQRATQTPGGMAGQRTRETHFAEVRQMCEMHPGLIIPRKKINVSAGAFGVRDEVTVQWKMALGWDSRVDRPTTPFGYSQEEVVRLRDLLNQTEAHLMISAADCARLEAELQKKESMWMLMARINTAVIADLDAERAKCAVLQSALEAELHLKKEAQTAIPRKLDRRKKIHRQEEIAP